MPLWSKWKQLKAEHSSLVGVLFGAVLIWFKYVFMGAFFPFVFLYGRGWSCGKFGHHANACPEKRRCWTCGGFGHGSRTARSLVIKASEALSTTRAIATILVTLPRLVRLTAKPPFWRSRRWHLRTLRPDGVCLAHEDSEPVGVEPLPTFPRESIAESADGGR